jgi:dolichol-phosphate mannosyltransferase
MTNKSLTIMTPVYNEQENVDYFLEKMVPQIHNLSHLYELEIKLTVIDNCSTDETVELLSKRLSGVANVNFEIISWVRNYGVMTSIYGGIIESNTDSIVVIDFDLQDPPELIGSMVERWLDGYSFVYGSRSKRHETVSTRTFRWIFNGIARVLKINLSVPVESGMWLLDRNVVNDLIANPPATKYLAGAVGLREYKSSYVKYSREKRVHGGSKFSTKLYFGYAFEALFSNPHRIARLSISLSLFTIFFGGIIETFLLACRYLFEIQIPNGLISSILIQVLSFSGIFLALGVIGEYVANIYTSVCRPAKTIAKFKIKG